MAFYPRKSLWGVLQVFLMQTSVSSGVTRTVAVRHDIDHVGNMLQRAPDVTRLLSGACKLFVQVNVVRKTISDNSCRVQGCHISRRTKLSRLITLVLF
jgi:hypothetical protein